MSATASSLLSVFPLLFKLRPGARLSDPEDFFVFCQDNAPYEFERSARGDLIVKMPTGGESGARNLRLSMFLGIWALTDGTGVGFDSNTGFELPNGALRAPDAAWVRQSRLALLSAEQKKKYLLLAPDFVAELRSDTDRLVSLKEKMEEYLDAGVALGILLDPDNRQAWVYRANVAVIELDDPATIDCSPELPGFLLDTRSLFDVTL